jgi:hypothetical protein
LAALPNGDVLVGANQAGTSRRGHVFVWTTAASRAADADTLAKFAKDSEPVPKAAAGEGGGGGGAPGLPPGVTVSGPYEARSAFPGTADGAYGFFSTPDGGVMVCAWSAAAGAWADVGQLSEGPDGGGGGGSGSGGGGGGGSGAGKGAGASSSSEPAPPPPPGHSAWDYTLGVTMETPQGMRSLQLCFNEDDDPNTVAGNFVAGHGIGIDSFEEVRDFILAQKAKRGPPPPKGPPPKVYKHFPTHGYLTLDAVDWKKVAPKLAEFNAALAADSAGGGAAMALEPAELAAVAGAVPGASVVAVLGDTSRWHASTVPRAGVKALWAKAVARWPAERLFPPLDVLRVLLCHPDGAEAVAEVAGAGFVPGLLGRLAGLKDRPDKEARGAVLLLARCLFNSLRHEPTRALVAGGAASASAVMDAVSDLLNHDSPPVKFAATVLLVNLVHAVTSQAAAAAAAAAKGGKGAVVVGSSLTASSSSSAAVPVDPSVVEQLLGLIVEGFQVIRPAAGSSPTAPAGAAADPAEEPTLKLLTALGSLVVCRPLSATPGAVARAAKGLELLDTVREVGAARFPRAVAVTEAVAELAPLLDVP